jgi:acyl-CoA thioester hydrolase
VRHAIAAETGNEPDLVNFSDVGFDFMLKTAQGTWHKGATYGDIITARCAVSRWGNTSFDVTVHMLVDEEPVFDCIITYVSTTPGAPKPVEVPEMIRRALDRSL